MIRDNLINAKDRVTLVRRMRDDQDVLHECALQYQAGADLAGVFVECFRPLLNKWARRYRSVRPYEDSFQDGAAALLKSIRTWSSEAGSDLLPWVSIHIKWAIARAHDCTGSVVRFPIHWLRKNGRWKRRVFTFTDMSSPHDRWSDDDLAFDESLVDERPLAEEDLSDDELERSLPAVVAALKNRSDLTPSQWSDVEDYYLRGLSDLQIAEKRDVTHQAVSVSRLRALEKMRHVGAQLLKARHTCFRDWVVALVLAATRFESPKEENMSWILTLTADHPIKESDLRQVLSKKDISKFPLRQAWGWSDFVTGLGVDIHLPKGKKLDLHGADYSAHLAKGAAEKVADGLRKLGYGVRIGRLSR